MGPRLMRKKAHLLIAISIITAGCSDVSGTMGTTEPVEELGGASTEPVKELGDASASETIEESAAGADVAPAAMGTAEPVEELRDASASEWTEAAEDAFARLMTGLERLEESGAGADMATLAVSEYAAASQAACATYVQGFDAIVEREGGMEKLRTEMSFEEFWKVHRDEFMGIYEQYHSTMTSLVAPAHLGPFHQWILDMMEINTEILQSAAKAYVHGQDQEALALLQESASVDGGIAQMQYDIEIQPCERHATG